MDFAHYAEKKESNTVKLQRLSKDFFQLISVKYNVDTGGESDPEVQNINIEAVEKAMTEVDKAVEQLQKRKEGLAVLKADMLALTTSVLGK